jgi:protein PhnA
MFAKKTVSNLCFRQKLVLHLDIASTCRAYGSMRSSFTKVGLHLGNLGGSFVPMYQKCGGIPSTSNLAGQMLSRVFSSIAPTDEPPKCPECGGQYTYYDGSSLFVCPDCSHEWPAGTSGTEDDQASQSTAPTAAGSGGTDSVSDCHGNVLCDGDDVILTKDLKVKGAQKTLKKGYKMRKIKIRDGGAGHDVECEGIMLKSEFLKKVV